MANFLARRFGKARNLLRHRVLLLTKSLRRALSVHQVSDISSFAHQENCDAIRSIGAAKFSDRLDSVKVESEMTSSAYRMEHFGISLLQPFDEASAKVLGGSLGSFFLELVAKGNSVGGVNLAIEDGSASYLELSQRTAPTVCVRSGQLDDGMIDVFRVDLLEKVCPGVFRSEIWDLLRGLESFQEECLANSIPGFGETKKIRTTNLYINNGVTSTRGAHVDSYMQFPGQFKIFTYLTDVFSLDDGPYFYAIGSARDEKLKAVNRSLAQDLDNATDCLFLPFNKLCCLLGGAGSTFITDQSGIHFGFPQCETGFRIVLVASVS